MVERIFGDAGPPAAPDDLLWLLGQADVADLPALTSAAAPTTSCSTDNVAFRDAAAAAGREVTVDFGPGEHDWAYWDARIQDVLAWLPLSTRA